MAEYHTQTQQNLAYADKQLDALVNITAQQKVVANQINSELINQNQQLEQVQNKMDNADVNVQKATEKVNKVAATKSACISWIISIILIIAIILCWVL